MKFWRRKRQVFAVPSRVVHTEGMERAEAEGRTVREKHWTLEPAVLDSFDDQTLADFLNAAFDYVTEAQIVTAKEDPTRPDDGRVELIVRGVPKE